MCRFNCLHSSVWRLSFQILDLQRGPALLLMGLANSWCFRSPQRCWMGLRVRTFYSLEAGSSTLDLKNHFCMYMAWGMGCFAMFKQKRGLTKITAVTLFTNTIYKNMTVCWRFSTTLPLWPYFVGYDTHFYKQRSQKSSNVLSTSQVKYFTPSLQSAISLSQTFYNLWSIA